MFGIDVDAPVAANDEETLNLEDESPVQPVNLSEVLEDAAEIFLSTHYRCAAHALNFVGICRR